MAITSGQIQIGLTPVHIDSASTNPSRIHIHNDDQTESLFLGGSEFVTITTGLQLVKLDSIELILNPGEHLYLVSNKTGHSVSWLRQDV